MKLNIKKKENNNLSTNILLCPLCKSDKIIYLFKTYLNAKTVVSNL